MSFPRYPQYKDSGVEWLGEVPEHWEVKRLRFVAQLNPSKSEASNLPRDTKASFLPMEAIGDDGSLNLERERELSEVETGYTYFRDGDVAVAKITPCFENGKGALMSGLLNGIGFGTTELIVARPFPEELLGAFLQYLFISPDFRKLGESHMYGAGGQKRVPDDFVRNFATAFPPPEEQAHIATFLDRETAKIDELVAEQRRLMELLKEKRQSVISHAVTRGLNPDAPLKPSGVEWLGDVPKHWRVGKLGRTCKLKGGFAFSAAEFGAEGIVVVRMNNLKRGRLDLSEAARIPESSCNDGATLSDGDLIWGMSGSTGETGSLGNYSRVRNEDLPCQLNQRVGRFVADPDELDLDFLEQVIQTAYFYEQIMLLVTGTAQFNVSSEQVQSCLVVLPPVAEQREIVVHLCRETAKIDALTAEAQRAIDLLQERRTALISAAVTGQIDVRDT